MSIGGIKYLVPWVLLLFGSCVKDASFDIPESNCETALEANIGIGEVKELYAGKVVQIQQELIMEGYVISSDRAGNFFGTLHLQDSWENPEQGIQVEMDMRDSHLWYPVGSKVLLDLKGLFLGKSGEVYKLGGSFSSFGNLSVGRLPVTMVPQHLLLSCGEAVDPKPFITTLDQLHDGMLNTLVSFQEVEVVESELGNAYAIFQEETQRLLKDCNGNEITLLNSGYADFWADPLPEGSGKVTAVLLKDKDKYQLVIRELRDVELSNARCVVVPDEFTSTAIFISELADPENNVGARFVELYNDATEDLDLNGWTLRRYTNANLEVSSTIDLSGFVIGAQSTFVISPNADEFGLVYGFAPDMGVSTNSPADSNGDDNLELVDPFGAVVDTFGLIGEDGSGTDHEFEDGRAVRKSAITTANPVYTFSEWEIYNDTGAAGTINLPHNAPMDFTPGLRD